MFCLGARMTRCIGFVFETNPKLLAENYFSFIFGYFQSVSVPSLRQVCHRQRTHALAHTHSHTLTHTHTRTYTHTHTHTHAHTHSHTHSRVSRLYRCSKIARRCVGEPVAFARTRGKSLRKCAHVVFKREPKQEFEKGESMRV